LRARSALGFVVALAASGGCAAAVPPPELVSARTAYEHASKGPSATLDPTDLHVAGESLDAAETSFAADGDVPATRDLGYTAQRKSETAEARARTIALTTDKNQVVADMNASTARRATTTAAQLTVANRELASSDQALQSETQRRQAAEALAAKAAADLAAIASVKQEARGMVITLNGSVLFTSGKWDLLPSASAKLNDVARALSGQDPHATMVVEGFTDSQGTVASNEELSRQRARTVRDYLVSRGIAADRITFEGFGPTRPIGDNGSAEGRANNRRVEIVVKQRP
jgi:outer membrane protein OmpA-like peptidoglycan-associated protein